jgi:hypothetical protein
MRTSTALILRDVAEEPMFDLIPLTRAWREVADVDAESCLVGQILEFDFPGTRAVAIATPSVGRDEQVRRVGLGPRAHRPPPLADRRDCEGRRVVIAPDAHPSLIPGHIEDAVGDRLAQGVVRKVVDIDFLRLPPQGERIKNFCESER